MIGFDGLLISDDLCMRALAGTPGERAAAALAAGCDVVLHCNGDLDEMREVADACPPLTAGGAAPARPGAGDAAGRRAVRSCGGGIGRLAALLGADGDRLRWTTSLYQISIWILPVLFAVTLHEAAHGFVAWRLGDDTA